VDQQDKDGVAETIDGAIRDACGTNLVQEIRRYNAVPPVVIVSGAWTQAKGEASVAERHG
jgi:hypothetical protein